MREILALLPRPGRYLGMEEGAARQTGADLHCALAFPDLYEVAMSYLGQKIVYGQLNAMPNVAAERVFARCRDAAEIMRQRGVRLATLETDTELAKTHLVGFSVTHELAFSNVLYMLDLAEIPLRSADRGDHLDEWPLILAGGGATLCAEPLAPFMDLMVLGESEAVLPELVALIMRARAGGWRKSALLAEARHVPGVYVPAHFQQVDGLLRPVFDDYAVVRRQAVADMDQAAYPVKQVVPFGAVHNRLSLEIARGCTRGCRFCQAGMTARPARERRVESIKTLLDDCLEQTGYDDISLLALSCGDFSALKTLLLDVADRCARDQVSLSLPSLRVGSVDAEIMARMADIRRTGVTLAPEAGSQRLRDVINKGINEESLLRHVRQLARYGWRQVKLYFMIGLPSETREDLDALVDLCLKVRDCCRPRFAVTASVSPFVPKAHTPFQWERQISLGEMEESIRYLRERFKACKGLTLRWHEPAMSHLEGILSRGDRRLADVLEKAFRKGGVFSSWMEGFSLAPWLEALAECGMTAEQWTGARENAPLPWDHIQAGVSRNFLRKEKDRAFAGQITDDCRYAACRSCGACDSKTAPSLLRARESNPPLRHVLNFPRRDQTDGPDGPDEADGSGRPGISEKNVPPALDRALVQRAVRYRVWHRKMDRAAWLSQLEMQSLLERAMRRAGLPLAFSQGFHPLPLLSFGRALPVGVGSLAEWFAITLRLPMSREKVMEHLAPRMLSGMECVSIDPMPLTGKIISAGEEIFRLECPEGEEEKFRCTWQNFAAAESFVAEKATKPDSHRAKGEVSIRRQDIRPLLRSLEFRQASVFLTLDWSEGYFSPLRLVREVMPWADPARLHMVKLTQSF